MENGQTQSNPNARISKTTSAIIDIKNAEKRTTELLNRLQTVVNKIEAFPMPPAADKGTDPKSLIEALSLLTQWADYNNDWLQSLVTQLEDLI